MIDRRAFYDQRAAFRVRETGRYYQQLLRKQYAFWVPPGLRVLEVGCGLGDLLAAVKSARGARGADGPEGQAVFERLEPVSDPRTRLVVRFFNNLWRPVLNAAAKVGLKSPTLLQNWLSTDDVKNLLHLDRKSVAG